MQSSAVLDFDVNQLCILGPKRKAGDRSAKPMYRMDISGTFAPTLCRICRARAEIGFPLAGQSGAA
jgi:hypothetical protein